MQARGRRSIWVLGGSGGCMWEGQRAGPAARRVCHGLGAGGGLDWRRGLEGRSRGTCSRGQLKFLKDDLVLENSARSCRRVADPGALAVWGGEWVPPNRVVATAAQTQDSSCRLSSAGCFLELRLTGVVDSVERGQCDSHCRMQYTRHLPRSDI